MRMIMRITLNNSLKVASLSMPLCGDCVLCEGCPAQAEGAEVQHERDRNATTAPKDDGPLAAILTGARVRRPFDRATA
jgi:hypothetical protein